MRPVYLGGPIGDDDRLALQWVLDALREIENASQDDLADVFAGYTVTNFTETRTLDATAATLIDVKNVFCTLIDDLKNRGTRRNQ